jgi:hypothetical protein
MLGLRHKVSEAPFLEQYFSVREAINSGERTPREFIDLLGTADASRNGSTPKILTRI